MRKLLASLVAVAFAMVLTVNALACDSAAGALTSVDSGKNSLVMKNECCGSDLTFVLKKETKVTLNGKEVKLTELKSGDKLVVNYEKMDDVLSIVATRNS